MLDFLYVNYIRNNYFTNEYINTYSYQYNV